MMRRAVIGVLAGICLVSGGYAAKTALDYRAEAEFYESTQRTFVTIVEVETPLVDTPLLEETIPTESQQTETAPTQVEVQEEEPQEEPPLVISLEPGISVDFEGLTQVNSQIVAWLHIPNTTMSYPVLQGENNQQYLDTAYNGSYSILGSIFMDYRINGDLTAVNTVIYGHNGSNGTMFGGLKAYREASYTETHPYFFLLTEEGYQRYAICAVIVTTATSSLYDLTFDQEGSFQQHLDSLAALSLYDTGVTATAQDTLVTLSTCTGVTQEERLVIVGRLDS